MLATSTLHKTKTAAKSVGYIQRSLSLQCIHMHNYEEMIDQGVDAVHTVHLVYELAIAVTDFSQKEIYCKLLENFPWPVALRIRIRYQLLAGTNYSHCMLGDYSTDLYGGGSLLHMAR